MIAVVVLVLLALVVGPLLVDAPTSRRRRQGITVWDEMWARGEITAEELMEIRAAQRKPLP